MILPNRPLLLALLLAALGTPATLRGAESEPRFRVSATLQPSSSAVADARYSLRSQLVREASPVSVRETGALNLTASFSPRAATCIIPVNPDLLFRDRFQVQP